MNGLLIILMVITAVSITAAYIFLHKYWDEEDENEKYINLYEIEKYIKGEYLKKMLELQRQNYEYQNKINDYESNTSTQKRIQSK